MKENTYYFPHDMNARNDEKIIKLQQELSMEGVGIYWCIIEMLYESGGHIDNDCERIAFALRTDKNIINKVLNNFNLFEIADNQITNRRVISTLNFRKTKSQKAKNSAKIKWKKHYANAERTQSERYAIKERKGKERKDISETSSQDENWSFNYTLNSWINGKDRAYQLIGRFFKSRGLVFENKKQMQAAGKRHLRAARELELFSDDQIKEALNKMSSFEELATKYTLETILKYISK